MIVLSPVIEALTSRMKREGWMDDMVRADKGALFGNLEDHVAVGVYKDSAPVGVFFVRHLGEDTRTAQVYLYVSRPHRGDSVAVKAMDLLLEDLFEGGIHRVEVDLPKTQGLRNAAGFLKKVGFTEEGVKKAALWVGRDECYNVHVYRILAPDWRKRCSPVRSAEPAVGLRESSGLCPTGGTGPAAISERMTSA